MLVAREAGLPLRMLICESGRRPLVAERMAEKLEPVLALCRQGTLLHVMSQMAAAPGVAGRDASQCRRAHAPQDAGGQLLQMGLDVLEQAGMPAGHSYGTGVSWTRSSTRCRPDTTTWW